MDMKWFWVKEELKLLTEITLKFLAVFYVAYLVVRHDQPERSKREDSQRCEMRCSEHCR